MDLSDQRISYESEGIDVASLDADPIAQFSRWFADAQAGPDDEPYAMVLSTVCLLYTSPSPRDQRGSRMPSSA